jgi:hypothetical protein
MSERLGFALVLLVALASVASIVFLSGAQPTGQVTYEHVCSGVRCPAHAAAQPLLDSRGYPVFDDYGKPVCICPR